MLSVSLNRLERYEEAIEVSNSVLDMSVAESLFVLIENAYLSLAESYSGLDNYTQAILYINRNLKFWKRHRVQMRIAVGAVQGFIISAKCRDTEAMMRYADIRKSVWIQFDSHWNIIRQGFYSLAMPGEAEKWKSLRP